MGTLYEPSNPLSLPFECFHYNSVSLPFPIKAHRHYFAELLLVRQGVVHLSCKDQERNLHSGEAYFIVPNTIHMIDSADNNPVYYDVIKLDINQFDDSPSYAPQMRRIFEDATASNVTPFFSAETVRELQLAERIEECLKEAELHAYGYDLMIRSILYTIMMQMLRHWMKNGYTINRNSMLSDSSSVFTITSYIDDHIREPFRVDDLASYCNLSYPSFAKKFREIYGITCKEYISQVRVAQAEHFLLFTDCELSYIAQETGYSDCSHMIKDFKRRKGVTPGKYRRERQSR